MPNRAPFFSTQLVEMESDDELRVHLLSFSDILLVTLLIYAIFLFIRKCIRRLSAPSAPKSPTNITTKHPYLHTESIEQHCATEFTSFPHSLLTQSGTSSASVEHLFVLIPGNPGISACYVPFMEHLYGLLSKRLDKTVGLVAVGFAGHTIFSHGNKAYDLLEQVEHQKKALHKLCAQFPHAKLYLLGHSIGCYIIKKILKDEGKLQFEKVFLMCPVMQHMKESSNYQSHKLFVRAPIRHTVSAIAHLIGSVMPERLQLAFISRITNITSIMRPIAPRLLNYSLLHNVLYLAHTEFESVMQLDKQVLEDHVQQLHVYFAHTDNWIPKEHVCNLLDIFNKHNRSSQVRMEQVHKTRHAFVIYPEDIPIVSQWITSFF